MEDPMSHKDALWRYRVVNFGNTTEKTFMVEYLNRNIRIKDLESLVKEAPNATEGYFKLRKTLKDMKLQRKQQSGYYRMIMDRCKLRAKAYERKKSAKGVVNMRDQPNWEYLLRQKPKKRMNADSPADHDMAQHPLNSDVGG